MWNLSKIKSRDCASLLTTCNMFKTLLKCFSGVLWTGLCLMWCFCFYYFFLDVVLAILNTFHTLIYFYQLSVLYWVQKKRPEAFFKKWCSLKLGNIYRKTLALLSLFNKVVGRQACNYIKKRIQHRCFLWNLRKFLRTLFLKDIWERLLSKSLARMD